MTTKEIVKGYKVFKPDFTCRNFKYEIGKTYIHKGKLELCKDGFHFCKNLNDCFNYYDFDPTNKVAEIEAVGEVEILGDKSVTNKIKIVREISWHDVLNMVNTGKDNTGRVNSGNSNAGSRNSGDRNAGYGNSGNRNSGHSNAGYGNSGDRNSGDSNAGYGNSGNRNSGHSNAGYRNSGDMNSGHSNAGYGNSGDRNSGNWNSGVFNACNYSNGFFNSQSPKIYMFNKPTNLTYEKFQKKYYEALNLLHYSKFYVTEWISESNMTDKEKEQHPKYKATEGYLKVRTYKEACKMMWDNFSETERNKIKKLPNFDEEVFEEITGIKV